MPEETDGADEIVLEALNEMHNQLIENTSLIRKELATSFSPVIFAGGVIALIGGGLILTIDNIFLNAISLILALFIAAIILVVRYFYLVRPIDSVVEYITSGTPFKPHKTIPLFEKLIKFNSSEEVYEAAVAMLDPDWLDFVPVFEENLAILHSKNEETEQK